MHLLEIKPLHWRFYILAEGTCAAYIKGSDGIERVACHYKPDDYFGELALLKEEPRAASIKTTASNHCIVVFMDK